MSSSFDRLVAALADRYRIEREIGQGGMATVYLAEDLKHRRKVAVKVLRQELAVTLGPERFFREIEVAAQLQHPHILPLHDSGEAGGFLYYVMPFVEGESLRERLTRQGEYPVHEAVRLLMEVADALAQAHKRGVVHRDIKPENILLSGRHALVTDFGVSKAVSEATGRQQLTTAGVALGTPAYMAPEQAAADPHLDQRVDIYALGVLGYELLTGRTPFAGKTPQETLSAHVMLAPDPPTRFRPGLSAPLEAVILKCLAKRPADRYQAAEELVQVLEPLATPSGGVTPTQTQPVPAVAPGKARLFNTARVLGGLAAVVLAVILFRRGDSSAAVMLGRQTRLTDAPGFETDPVLSPDGRLVAYAAGPFFTSHIYVRQLSGGPSLDLTPGLPGRHVRPRWAPGGDDLLFVTKDGDVRRVSRVSALGGTPRTLVEFANQGSMASADWSPDGKLIAFDRASQIHLAESNGGGNDRVVYDGTDPHSISWSPDGKHLAFVEGGNRLWRGATGISNTAPSSILVVPVTGGEVDTVIPRNAVNLSPSWAPDSRSLFFVSSLDGAKDLWRIPLASSGRGSGPPKRLTTGLAAQTLNLSSDGRTMVFSTLLREANVWMLPIQPGRTIDDDAAVQVTTGSQVIERMSLSPDGRWLVYDSDRRGNVDIYRQRLDEPNAVPEQLTSDSADDYSPAPSPDGKEILFHSLRSGNRDLWVMGFDGSNPRQLTHAAFDEYSGAWFPHGDTVVYYGDSASAFWLGIVPRKTDGSWGEPRLVFEDMPGASSVGMTPHGTRIVGTHNALLSIVDPATWQVTPVPGPIGTSAGVRIGFLTADGLSIYYRAREPDGRLSLQLLHLNGDRPDTLVRPHDASRAALRGDWTTHGKQLFFTINKYEGDIWTVEVR
jgi:Tol biopolymer transport system component/tRNA A-37 threonylcarbamoyl transferase component Bud32